LFFPFEEKFLTLGCGRHFSLVAVVQRFVDFSTYPQAMEQHGQLSCRRDDRSFLPAFSAALG
jgi:hypothetical protein